MESRQLSVTASLVQEGSQRRDLCSAFLVWQQHASRNAVLARRLKTVEAQKRASLLKTAFEALAENMLLAREADTTAEKARSKPSPFCSKESVPACCRRRACMSISNQCSLRAKLKSIWMYSASPLGAWSQYEHAIYVLRCMLLVFLAFGHLELTLVCMQMASKQQQRVLQSALDSWNNGVVQTKNASLLADQMVAVHDATSLLGCLHAWKAEVILARAKKAQLGRAEQLGRKHIRQRGFRALQESRAETQ